ncbi:MAG TPA: FecR domain-containing protein [Mucilaginibacter sp.]|jgi:ferric-dicitrate binding protein FerR (iron transport regulator)
MSESEYQRKLIQRYKDNTASEKELQALFGMLSTDEINAAMEEDMDREIAALNTPLQKKAPKRNSFWYKYSVAAVALIAVSVSLFYQHLENSGKKHSPVKAMNDISPGRNVAYLILSSGKRLALNNVANGAVVKEAGVKITKTAAGQLVYVISDKDEQTANSNLANTYNTIETPKGGQYQIVLPDGSKVWLNAASSLKYPVFFTALKTRRVELTGEGYFEVAKKKDPFIVQTAQQEVEVLGTHFNINAYTDEPNVKTTLLEGSVHVTALLQTNGVRADRERAEGILKPGQQSVLTGSAMAIKDVETDEAVAWKNGQFMFTSEPITAIMRKISRWYNVDIEYKGNVASKKFTGSVSRYSNVSEVLQTLELTDRIRFQLNGRKITVIEKTN